MHHTSNPPCTHCRFVLVNLISCNPLEFVEAKDPGKQGVVQLWASRSRLMAKNRQTIGTTFVKIRHWMNRQMGPVDVGDVKGCLV